MTEKYLLVDYENVLDVELGRLPSDVTVLFVLGAKQEKLPSELAMQAQLLGERFKYVPIRGQQPNAVDFCIAYYLGEYLTRNARAECVILSKDKKGFDPLVKYLVTERGFKVRRVNTQKDAFPLSNGHDPSAAADPYERIQEILKKEKQRPLKRKGLEGKIKSYLPRASEPERAELLKRLFEQGVVSETGGALEYLL